MAIQKRPGFESELGSLESPGVTAVGGTNAKPGNPLTSQDASVNLRGTGSQKLTPFSAVNNENPGAIEKKLDPKDFIQRSPFDDKQVPNENALNSQSMFVSDDWLEKAKEAFRISDSFFQSDIKPKLEDNIRAFNSQHKMGSIYTRAPMGWTSKLYKPKTREVINKYQAASSIAFFSNQDMISIEPQNPYDAFETTASQFYKALLQFRLKRTLPWFLLSNGAFQDSLVQGVVIGHVCWAQKGNKPCIKILPLDKVRFDPEADWMDPVNDSPYWITIKEITVGEYKEMVAAGKFFEVSDGDFTQAKSASAQDLDKQRGQNKTEGGSYTSVVKDYERIIVQEHIHRSEGKDVIFHVLGWNPIRRVSNVVPLEEAYLHGLRPYVLGYAEIESHRVFVSGLPEMLSALQEELNEITNQRLNNVKLVMNKKIAVKSGSDVDLSALLRNQPGAAVFMENPKEDFVEINTPDVTQSAYLEQQELERQFDSLAGSFNPPVGMSNRQPDSGRTMQMLNASTNMLLEYRLRTFATTFITPILNLLAATERTYETDIKVLELIARNTGIVRDPNVQIDATAGGTPGVQDQNAGAPPQAPPMGGSAPLPSSKGMPTRSEFNDEMLAFCRDLLKQELNIDVNVGMNATDPMLKLQKLVAGLSFIAKELLLNPKALAVFDIEEVAKEVLALSGYIDGLRFLKRDQDPKVKALEQQVMQLQMMLKFKLQEKQLEGQNRFRAVMEKERHADMRKAAELQLETKALKMEAAQFTAEHSNEVVQKNEDQAAEQKRHQDEMAMRQTESEAPDDGPETTT